MVNVCMFLCLQEGLPNRPGSGTTKLQLLSLWAFWNFDLLLLLLAAARILSVTNSVRKLLPNRPGSGTTKLQLLSLWAFWNFDLLLLLLAATRILSLTNFVRKLLPNRPGSGTTKLQLYWQQQEEVVEYMTYI